ncbi:hypothetical protein DOK67_0000406 [Enterococcus sp. DIV0212c]|uniref:lactococcin 972 family bacteriocin n=1 Tax=Enterococcus sp. DIV0212c TaxID=2230867 RepID=UPI001A9BC159|nr:lactococcin 972 family bacteriocin [Enterococcus sp. DIV0212c]MBO1352956.1 4a-hydroxytetrahydrobiopterin dehydratase [Enterococcus sp. DIV0212c]
MTKKLKRKVVGIVMLSALFVGGLSASAAAFNTFYGGVTGIPGFGTTWGSYYPRGKRVYVTAKGRTTSTRYASSGGTAHASVSRAFSGNRSWWGNA